MAAVPALAAPAAILILILTCFLAPFLYIQLAHLRWCWLSNCGPCAWLVWVDCLQLWAGKVLVWCVVRALAIGCIRYPSCCLQ
jgi:hypothetical protein